MGFTEDFLKFVEDYKITGVAIGFVIGLAAKDLINDFVDSLINPLLSILFQRVDFSTIAFEALGSKFLVGAFINSTIKFALIILVVFVAVKYLVKASPKPKKGKGKK